MAAQAFLLIASFLLVLFVFARPLGNSAGAADKQRAIAGHAKY